jgi:hypothetical protein
LDVLSHTHSDLTSVAEALSLPSLLASLAEHGEQDCSQNRNDGNHHEQLNQGETDTRTPLLTSYRSFHNFSLLCPHSWAVFFLADIAAANIVTHLGLDVNKQRMCSKREFRLSAQGEFTWLVGFLPDRKISAQK